MREWRLMTVTILEKPHNMSSAQQVNPPEIEYMQQRCHDRQETVKRRCKQWGILKQRYHHEIVDHEYDLRVVAV